METKRKLRERLKEKDREIARLRASLVRIATKDASQAKKTYGTDR